LKKKPASQALRLDRGWGEKVPPSSFLDTGGAKRKANTTSRKEEGRTRAEKKRHTST